MRKKCLEMIYNLALQDPRIVFLGSDLGAGTMSEFRNDMPDRFFMEGICEANLIGMAAGMAMEGKIPYVNTIAPFLTRRAYEQIILDLCLHNIPVRLVGNGGGLVYAPLGPTHQVIEDFAALRSIPNMCILSPSDAREMEKMMPETVNWPGPIYIRLAKGYDPIVTPLNLPFVIGKAVPVKIGKDILITTTGITLNIALEAEKLLKNDKNHNLTPTILHLPTIKPFDKDTVSKFIKDATIIVSVEEHSITGGLGSAVAELLAEKNDLKPRKFKRIGIPDKFSDRYGSQNDLLKYFGITPENVEKIILKLWESE
ncbi:Transketolase, central region:Transketolase, C terminal [Desulfamplus magnetovallimortis]|uniref:Transketolase, central region:Transketolase, C terminal n=1 Tax=Desulfamplus magnetovallimortis TaxID=1246637 RepID=A0A1W1HF27_9BACT|nr:transketolase C-terminal domain-containing protein [Desulfamplus magnetovallimortis]SLM30982.1 Transketolase, central region:Transketolase, C terminal [Desulfamplus magnetovallimortis]